MVDMRKYCQKHLVSLTVGLFHCFFPEGTFKRQGAIIIISMDISGPRRGRSQGPNGEQSESLLSWINLDEVCGLVCEDFFVLSLTLAKLVYIVATFFTKEEKNFSFFGCQQGKSPLVL